MFFLPLLFSLGGQFLAANAGAGLLGTALAAGAGNALGQAAAGQKVSLLQAGLAGLGSGMAGVGGATDAASKAAEVAKAAGGAGGIADAAANAAPGVVPGFGDAAAAAANPTAGIAAKQAAETARAVQAAKEATQGAQAAAAAPGVSGPWDNPARWTGDNMMNTAGDMWKGYTGNMTAMALAGASGFAEGKPGKDNSEADRKKHIDQYNQYSQQQIANEAARNAGRYAPISTGPAPSSQFVSDYLMKSGLGNYPGGTPMPQPTKYPGYSSGGIRQSIFNPAPQLTPEGGLRDAAIARMNLAREAAIKQEQERNASLYPQNDVRGYMAARGVAPAPQNMGLGGAPGMGGGTEGPGGGGSMAGGGIGWQGPQVGPGPSPGMGVRGGFAEGGTMEMGPAPTGIGLRGAVADMNQQGQAQQNQEQAMDQTQKMFDIAYMIVSGKLTGELQQKAIGILTEALGSEDKVMEYLQQVKQSISGGDQDGDESGRIVAGRPSNKDNVMAKDASTGEPIKLASGEAILPSSMVQAAGGGLAGAKNIVGAAAQGLPQIQKHASRFMSQAHT